MFPKKNDDSDGVVPIPIFKSYLVKKKKKKKKRLLKQSTKSTKDKMNEYRILSHLLISPDSNKKIKEEVVSVILNIMTYKKHPYRNQNKKEAI